MISSSVSETETHFHVDNMNEGLTRWAHNSLSPSTRLASDHIFAESTIIITSAWGYFEKM